MSGTSWFSHMDTSQLFARDYTCPARLQGVRTAAPANNPRAIGTAVTAANAAGGFTECAHTVGNPFNDRLGQISHLGISTTYSNPGTLVIPVGLKVLPVKGHQISGWYVYRGMVSTKVLEVAFAPELAGRSIGKTQWHEVGGFWMWTVNPHFDIRLAGNVGIPGGGWKNLARLADCNRAAAGLQACSGDDIALAAEARFRARF